MQINQTAYAQQMARANPLDGKPGPEFSGDGANHGLVLTAEQARQGVVSGRVVLVLTVSLMLTLVAFAVIYAAYA